jgi:hypothetical protein
MKGIRIILVAIMTLGSEGFAGGSLSCVAEPVEMYRLMSDRSIYIAGEPVKVRVFNLNPEHLAEQAWSSVYYLELISPGGSSYSRAKLPLTGSGASGVLHIPEEIPSGTYFLEGYTRWTRNYGAGTYQYVSIEVINPLNSELLPADTASGDYPLLHRPSPCFDAGETLSGNVRDTYSRRERVELKLSGALGSHLLDCCVTVVRKGSLGKQWEQLPVPKSVDRNELKFLPETQGITLSGKVEKIDSGEPAPYSVVYLSSLGGWNEFYATHSDSAGRFYFLLKEGTGETEYFISSRNQDQTDLGLYVDQDFSTDQPALPSFPLETLHHHPGLVSELSLNRQIREQYLMDIALPESVEIRRDLYFYGRPDVVIRFDDFIRLPELEEYFKEVIPQVSLRRIGGIRGLRVHGTHPELQFYAPLIMVDGVAIFDTESLLSIDPRYVERVEIIRAPYIRGNVTFGGIIHVITRNGKMGTIDLPSSGLLIQYHKYSDHPGETEDLSPSDPRIPDTRNTLFWEPSVVIKPGESKELVFHAPDRKGTYEIIIRGYGPDSACHEERILFRVD